MIKKYINLPFDLFFIIPDFLRSVLLAFSLLATLFNARVSVCPPVPDFLNSNVKLRPLLAQSGRFNPSHPELHNHIK